MNKESIFRKSVLAGIGIYSMTREKAQEVIDDLVKKGELSKEEGPQFVKTLMEKADEEVAYLRQMVDSRVEKAMSKFKPSYDAEFKKINEKLDKIVKELHGKK